MPGVGLQQGRCGVGILGFYATLSYGFGEREVIGAIIGRGGIPDCVLLPELIALGCDRGRNDDDIDIPVEGVLGDVERESFA